VYVKEEGANPTGNFQGARPCTRRHHGSPLRVEKSSPSRLPGTPQGALAAYAAAAGIEAHIFMPKDVPIANHMEGVAYGAKGQPSSMASSPTAPAIVNERKTIRRLVRHLHPQGALSASKEKKTHGLRTRRAARLAISRRCLLIQRAAA